MTYDELLARLQELVEESPHVGALPVAIRATRKAKRQTVLDLRFADPAHVTVDGLVHAEIVVDLTRSYEQSGTVVGGGRPKLTRRKR